MQVNSLETQITEWHKNDIVTLHDHVPEDGWVSPFHLVLKPNTDPNKPPTIRWCSDMRSLNNQTKPLIVNLPAIEDNLLLLTGSKYFSSLDLSQAYFHIPIANDSLKYMYQACPNYYCRYKFMPIGFKNAGAYFSLWVRNLHEKLPAHL